MIIVTNPSHGTAQTDAPGIDDVTGIDSANSKKKFITVIAAMNFSTVCLMMFTSNK